MNHLDQDGRILDTIWDIYSVASGIYSAAKNTIKGNFKDALLDVVGVGADLAAVVVPGVPAVGSTTVKAIKTGDNLVDAAKVLNKADDVVDAGKTTKTLKKGPDPNGGKGGKHGNPDHNKAIDDAIKALPKKAKNIRKIRFKLTFMAIK